VDSAICKTSITEDNKGRQSRVCSNTCWVSRLKAGEHLFLRFLTEIIFVEHLLSRHCVKQLFVEFCISKLFSQEMTHIQVVMWTFSSLPSPASVPQSVLLFFKALPAFHRVTVLAPDCSEQRAHPWSAHLHHPVYTHLNDCIPSPVLNIKEVNFQSGDLALKLQLMLMRTGNEPLLLN
jgi:hypothetical protein